MSKYSFIIIVILVIIAAVGFVFIKIQAPQSPKTPKESEAGLEKTIEIGKEAPDVTFTTLDGKEMRLSDFKGKSVMFWFVATWCPTCQAGAKVLSEEKMTDIEKYGLKIVVLKLWNNLGYPGPSLEEFGRESVGENFDDDNWVWAEADQKTSFLYDPRGLPDIYYLIDKNGVIQAIDTAPSATVDKIVNFAAQ